MIKIILVLLVGIGLGGAAGFYEGSIFTEKKQKEILISEQEKCVQQVQEAKECKVCNEEKAKIEEENKALAADLKLNESRPGFVSSGTLSAPEFSPSDIEVINSNKSGDVIVNWVPVKGAKQYLVTVETKEGKAITTIDVEGETSVYLNRIPHAPKLSEAEYFVRIATMNGLDQLGPQGERKPIHFSSQSFKVNKKQKQKKAKNKH